MIGRCSYFVLRVNLYYRLWRTFGVLVHAFLVTRSPFFLFLYPLFLLLLLLLPPLASCHRRSTRKNTYARLVIYSCADCTHYGAAWRVSDSITSRIRTWLYE